MYVHVDETYNPAIIDDIRIGRLSTVGQALTYSVSGAAGRKASEEQT